MTMTGSPLRVFVLRPNEDWIVDTIAQDYEGRTSHQVVRDPAAADVIWLLGSWCWTRVEPYLKGKTVICTVHHVVPSKFDFSQFRARDQYVSCYLVYTIEAANAIKDFTSKPILLSYHWIDTKKWFPVDRLEARSRLKIGQDDFIIGSFQRDTEGSDLVSPKLEKGPDIFCDVVERISRARTVSVLLGGWRREYVINRLRKAGIKHDFRELPPQEVIRDMYASCDLYLCTSRIEGGPQCILEAASMQVPIFTTPVGIAKDILHESQIIDPARWTPPLLEDHVIRSSFQRAVSRDVDSLVPVYDDLILAVHGMRGQL